jgi:hypothetical protein
MIWRYFLRKVRNFMKLFNSTCRKIAIKKEVPLEVEFKRHLEML